MNSQCSSEQYLLQLTDFENIFLLLFYVPIPYVIKPLKNWVVTFLSVYTKLSKHYTTSSAVYANLSFSAI